MAAAEFSVKVSGAAAAAERSPLRWPPPLAASCRVVQNGGGRRSRAGLLSSASGPPRNLRLLLPFPGRPGRGSLQSALSGGRGARTACERGGPRASAGGTRPAAGPGRWRGTSEADESGARPPGGEEVCRLCGRSPRSGRARRRAVTGDFEWRRRADGRPPSCGRTKGRPEGAPPARPRPSPVGSPATHRPCGRNPLLFCSRVVGRRFPLPCCGPALPAASHKRPVGRGERTGGGQSGPGSE